MEGNCNPMRLDPTGRSAALASSRANPGAKQVELQKAKPLPTTAPVSVFPSPESIAREVHSERYSSAQLKYFAAVQKYFRLRPRSSLLNLAHNFLKQLC